MFVYNTPYSTQPDYLSDRRRVSLGVPDDTHSTGVKRVKVLVPIPMDAAGVANRAQQLPPEFVAPGFKPEFAAVKWGAALGDSYHDMLLMDWTVFQAGIDAEDEGYAGALIDTVSDSGLRALRSRTTARSSSPRGGRRNGSRTFRRPSRC